jgi:hypothetical protein
MGRDDGIHRYRRKDNIKTVLQELKCAIINWIQVAQERAQSRILDQRNDYRFPRKNYVR